MSVRSWRAVVCGALSLMLAACGGGSLPTSPTSPTQVPAGVPSTLPTLVSPVNGGAVQQNDAATGCRYDPLAGYGFRVTFEWTAVPGFNTYEVQLKGDYASVPLLERVIQGTRYEYVACNVIIPDGDPWRWKVRAVAPAGPASDWSTPYYIYFMRCWLAADLPCGVQRPG